MMWKGTTMQVRPFTIAISEVLLTELRDRLVRTRWPDEINDDAWAWGTRADVLSDLMAYWAHGYDWRAQEAALNRLPQFRAEIDGLGVHFLHVRGKGPNARPLLITHGWPGSFIEMRELIPLLSEGSECFDLVIPSLPGYGFSDAPTAAGMSPAAIAGVWVKLMQGLGYARFGLQGGDWGAIVSTALAINHPDCVIGFHLNFLSIGFPPPADSATEPEHAYLAARAAWLEAEGGYSHMHGTKPQTLAYGLSDSPTGLAAWILEKFRTWSDCRGDPIRLFGRDDLLTNIAIYWFSNSISSSLRLYKEARMNPLRLRPGQRVTPPMAFAQFPVEIPCPPRALVERHFDLRQWTEMPRGGHFAAMEQPGLLAEDIRSFFRTLT
jgi:pimeloyl-ACP methyl ester carboxylesterase